MQSTDAKEPEAAEEQMDYDELTLNPLLAEIESEAADGDGKGGKPRRYWTPKEEERFFEIWGRDNWRLTRHGKNTVFFAQWSSELKERFDIDVKLEEIQAKVNQTRAKFRQVKKQVETDKGSARWKKYDIIAKILKNQYRPKDAEPVPLQALECNRDFSSDELTRQHSPTSITTSNSNTQDGTHATLEQSAGGQAATGNGGGGGEGGVATEEMKPEIDLHDEPIMSTVLYNNSSSSNNNSAHYSTELFSDEVKQEFEDEVKTANTDYHSGYGSYPYPEQNHYGGAAAAPAHEPHEADAEPQLHQLQTPQQQQQQQMQQYQQYRPEPSASAPPTATAVAAVAAGVNQAQPLYPPHLPPAGYEHTSNAYANHSGANNTPLLGNPAGSGHYPPASTAAGTPPLYPQQYGAGANYAAHNNHSGNSRSMQPPTRAVHAQPRKRRTSSATANNMLVPVGPGGESLECMYLEEVRKKNAILAEQKDIASKRLVLEERKVALLEQFFPKCLELQQQILQKLNSN